MANTRRAVRQDERTVAILCLVLLMLLVTAGVIWLNVYRMLHTEVPVLPTEVELFPVLNPLSGGMEPEIAPEDQLSPDVETSAGKTLPPAAAEEIPVAAMPSQNRWTLAQLPTVLKQVPEKEPFVYLTFDDGPTKYLPAIVDVLIAKQVPATFFWIGRYSPPAAELLHTMRDARLQVGTHTVDHRRLAGLSYAAQRREIQRGIATVAEWTGVETVYVRPPYGAWDERTQKVADDLGLKLVLWSVDPRDWEKDVSPDVIVERVLAHLHPGAVVLLHETESTAQALPTLIDRIRQNGFQPAALPYD